MGEEMRMMRDYGSGEEEEEEEEEEERVLEWEEGLPNAGDLTPLSQHLIPPELASAFSIKAEPLSTMLDVHRASQKTLSTLLSTRTRTRTRTRRHITNNLIIKPFSTTFTDDEDHINQSHEDPMVVKHDDDDDDGDPPGTPTKDGSETRKIRRVMENNNTEEADSGLRTENSNNYGDDHHSARTLKRPRLVWTPQLHKRFVDVVAHLGIRNAVPKTIMQLMNVEGLTRENVASHLQKYRLYLKRMQGLSNEGPSSSDPLFASTPVPHTLHEPPQPPSPPLPLPLPLPLPPSGNGSTSTGKGKHISLPPPPMPYGGGPMLPMPVLGHGLLPNPAAAAAAYQGFEFHPYGRMFADQQRDWSGSNRFGPMLSYPKASK